MTSVAAEPGTLDESRMRPHRRGHAIGALELVADEAPERRGHALEGETEGGDTAAVHGDGDLVSAQACRFVERGEHLDLKWMLAEAVVLERPALCGADAEEAGVLTRAVVLDPAAVHRATLEVVLGGSGAREELADGRQLLGPCVVRGRGDGDVLLGEVVVRADEEKRLDRLGGRAHERDESGVATLLGKRSSRVDASGVNAMARLGHPASDDGYCERIHGRGA